MSKNLENVWLTVEEAADALECSTRHVGRRAAQTLNGRPLIRKQLAPRLEGEKTPRVIYNAADIERLRNNPVVIRPSEQQQLLPAIAHKPVPSESPTADGLNLPALLPSNASTAVLALLAPLFERVREIDPPKTWLTIDEAVAASGLPSAWLRRGAVGGILNAIDVSTRIGRHSWRFHREGLSDSSIFERIQQAAGVEKSTRRRRRS